MMATVWMTVTVLKCRRLHFLCTMPYIHFKSTNVHITVCGYIDWDMIHSYTFTSGLTEKNNITGTSKEN